MIRFFVATIACVALLTACNSGPAPLTKMYPKQLDLIEYGVPLKIQGPEDVKVANNGQFGPVQDLEIEGTNYFMQIVSNDAGSGDCKTITERELAAVKEKSAFASIVEQNDCGFIYALQYEGDTTKLYNFKAIQVKGAKQYIFETTATRGFSLDQVKSLFSVAQYAPETK